MRREEIEAIASEFLGSDESQVRKNALTALSVLATPGSLELLARTSMSDADAGVRERASDEIARLDPTLASTAIESLWRTLVEGGEHWRQAYVALGRLRGLGVPLTVPRGVGLRRRLGWA